jgi:hypothetical protein
MNLSEAARLRLLGALGSLQHTRPTHHYTHTWGQGVRGLGTPVREKTTWVFSKPRTTRSGKSFLPRFQLEMDASALQAALKDALKDARSHIFEGEGLYKLDLTEALKTTPTDAIARELLQLPQTDLDNIGCLDLSRSYTTPQEMVLVCEMVRRFPRCTVLVLNSCRFLTTLGHTVLKTLTSLEHLKYIVLCGSPIVGSEGLSTFKRRCGESEFAKLVFVEPARMANHKFWHYLVPTSLRELVRQTHEVFFSSQARAALVPDPKEIRVWVRELDTTYSAQQTPPSSQAPDCAQPLPSSSSQAQPAHHSPRSSSQAPSAAGQPQPLTRSSSQAPSAAGQPQPLTRSSSQLCMPRLQSPTWRQQFEAAAGLGPLFHV